LPGEIKPIIGTAENLIDYARLIEAENLGRLEDEYMMFVVAERSSNV
jgi:hypothetical protein